MEAGLRVVRGPDWIWSGQDGGEGHVGTIVRPGKAEKDIVFNHCVFVLWDSGQLANYRVGHGDCYDLRVFDTALIGSKHVGVKCNACAKFDIIGTRWSCSQCINYNLCNQCYTSDRHDLNHTFRRFDIPSSKGAPVPPRNKSRKVEAMGIYAGAAVVRGPDWKWNDQDGGHGSPGLVCEITDKHDSPLYQSWCKVTWERAGSNEYRRGHEGALDLSYVIPSSGGYYYPTHLAKLSKEFGKGGGTTEARGGTSPGSAEIRVGDKVCICLEPDIFQALQEGHGGWNEMMTGCIGKVGRVVSKMDSGDFLVHFNEFQKPWRINPIVLTKQSDFKGFRKGDMVKISGDETLVSKLQVGHGGWTPAMKPVLGKVGKVMDMDGAGDLGVRMNGQRWTFNPHCCMPHGEAQRMTMGSNDCSTDGDADDLVAVASLGDADDLVAAASLGDADDLVDVASLGDADDLVAIASLGDADLVRQMVSLHPDKMEAKNRGKTALQMACLKGHMEIIEILLSTGADIMARDDEGDTPVHFAVFEDQPKALEILIAHGSDVNVVNEKLQSPLHLAVHKGYKRCVEVLLKNKCSTNLKDVLGDTALHDAISSRKNDELVEMLLEAPDLDFSTKNERGFNVLHQAGLTGNSRAVECILKRAPELVDVKKDDGMTTLHIAAINGHRTVVETLIKIGRASIEELNVVGHTALQIAVWQNQMSVVEALVLNGANVNVFDEEGSSPLCAILNWMKNEKEEPVRRTEVPRLNEAPAITQIKVSLPPDLKRHQWLPVAIFLVRHGAGLHTASSGGKTPIDVIRHLPSALVNILEENSSSSDALECVMCSNNPVEVTFQPCGHRIACRPCGQRMKKCFECKNNIQSSCGESLPSKQQEFTVHCTNCNMNDRNVVFLCGHGCCDKCLKEMKTCHVCKQSTENCVTLF